MVNWPIFSIVINNNNCNKWVITIFKNLKDKLLSEWFSKNLNDNNLSEWFSKNLNDNNLSEWFSKILNDNNLSEWNPSLLLLQINNNVKILVKGPIFDFFNE